MVQRLILLGKDVELVTLPNAGHGWDNEGLAQTREYMDRCAAAEGHLVIFDRTAGRPWREKVFRREEISAGVPVTVWGM